MRLDKARELLSQIYELSVIGDYDTNGINKELGVHLSDDDVKFFINAFEAPLHLIDIENKGMEKSIEFYKKFYNDNRVRLLQYNSLRFNFNKMIENVLGVDYYNSAMDVYESDRISCEDITTKAKSFF